MQTSPREEVLSGGSGGPEDPAGEAVRAGEAPEGPGLIVFALLHSGYEDYELVGIRSSEEKARELAEETWETYPIGGKRRLRWDDHGAYYFLNGKRRDAGFLIEEHTVI